MTSSMLLQAWPFIHPGIAAAAAAAALIPILIHLINRKRFRRVPWAAMSFLMAANRRSARRVRLENLLLLALRMLIVAGAGLAVARPYVSNATLGLRSSRVDRFLVLDTSLSMNAVRPDGRTRFEAAHEFAQQLVQAFPPGDGVALLTTAQPAQALIETPTHDRRFVRETLAGVTVTQAADDMVGALALLQTNLAASDAPPGNRAVYLISDFPEEVWGADRGSPTAAGRAMREVALLLGEPDRNLNLTAIDPGHSDNLAVTDFQVDGSFANVQVPTMVTVEVANFGPATARGATLQLREGSQTSRRADLPPIGAGERTKTVFSITLSKLGSQVLEAKLSARSADALPLDDTRWLALEVRDAIPVLVVDGQPGGRLIEGQSGYLAFALSPPEDSPRSVMHWGRSQTNLYDVKVITEPELGTEISHAFEIIALCNVPRLSPQQWEALTQFVSRGGGLFVSGGGLISAENYNRFGFADGRGVLPARLSSVLDVSQSGQRVGFQLPQDGLSIFSEFSDHHNSGLFSARVDRYWTTESLVPNAQTPLRYTDGSPAVFFSKLGEGRVALWTTTVNMEWNNLAGRGDFIPVMAKVFGALTPSRGAHRNLIVGDTLIEPLSPAESSMPLTLSWGEGQSAPPTIAPVNESLVARHGPMPMAGPVTLSIGEAIREFSVNIDPRESRLQSADPAVIESAVGVPLQWVREKDVPVFSAPGSVEWSATLMWLVVGLLLVELWLAQRFAAPLPARVPARSGSRVLSAPRRVLEAVS